MTKSCLNLRQFVFAALLLKAWVLTIVAQSAVFFVPSTDIQEKKTIYFEADAFAHFDSYENGGFQSYGPSIAYGLSKNVEIGVNYYFTNDIDGSAHELQPNIKWKAYNNDNNGVAVAVGSVVFVPLNDVAGTKTSAMFYANASKTFKSAKDMRLTGGVYTMANTDDEFGTKTGVLVGIEQPITEKLTLLADWTSGKNRLGYSNIGFGYEVKKSQYLAAGYTFGNSGRGNNFLSVFYGFTF
jgi:hypothetical protein